MERVTMRQPIRFTSVVVLALAGAAATTAFAAIPVNSTTDLPCGGSVIVERGDTLGAIAEQCGVDVASILSVNPSLENPDRLASGERITIPGAVAAPLLESEALEEILAPIALYPDALLAEMLPASTYPLEVVQAHRWVQAGNEADELESDDVDWASSVQALVRYPEVLSMMSNDLDWTISLGDAFLGQPDDVFDTIQILRARAKDVGNLESNEHQVVVTEPVETVEVVEPVIERRTVIRIVPARREYIYVPHYDPFWAYRPYSHHYDYYHGPLFHYSAGYVLGGWLSHYLDWHHYHVRLYPYHYRHARYYHDPYVYHRLSAHRWYRWHHQPIHRRGYGYHTVPRVRVREGQRHLVHVSRPNAYSRRNASSFGQSRQIANRTRAVASAERAHGRGAGRAITASRDRAVGRAAVNTNGRAATRSRSVNRTTLAPRTFTDRRTPVTNTAPARVGRDDVVRRLAGNGERRRGVARDARNRAAPRSNANASARDAAIAELQNRRNSARANAQAGSSRRTSALGANNGANRQIGESRRSSNNRVPHDRRETLARLESTNRGATDRRRGTVRSPTGSTSRVVRPSNSGAANGRVQRYRSESDRGNVSGVRRGAGATANTRSSRAPAAVRSERRQVQRAAPSRVERSRSAPRREAPAPRASGGEKRSAPSRAEAPRASRSGGNQRSRSNSRQR